jgi:hypothetical protein
MQERMETGKAVMREFRKRLGNELPKSGDRLFDYNLVPATLINAVAAKYTIHDRDPEINRREILRCLKKICNPPVGTTGNRGKYANISDSEFDAPLNGDFIGSKFAANDPYWFRQRSNTIFATFAWVLRILSARTRKTRKEKVINEKTGCHRYKTVEVIGRTATATEILIFLKAFWKTKPKVFTAITSGIECEPGERVKNAAMAAFAPDYQVSLAAESVRGVDANVALPPLVDNFLSSWRRGAWQESDLDELLSTVHQLLDISRWDTWEWIKEDIYRLEDKYWDFGRLNQCGGFVKNIIRKAVELIVNKRGAVKHRSPFISPMDIYDELAGTGELIQIETTTSEPKKPSPNDSPARVLWLNTALKTHQALKKECCLAKIRRGLREMLDVVAEVKTEAQNTKFRLVALGLNNSNRRTSRGINLNQPTYIASTNLKGACVLEDTTQSIQPANPSLIPSPPLSQVNEADTSVEMQPTRNQNKPAEPKKAVKSTAFFAVADQSDHGKVKTEGELELAGETKGRRKDKAAKNRAGRSTYTIKVDSTSGNVTLGKKAQGKDSTKIVNGYQQRQLQAIVTRNEIPVIINRVKKAKFDQVQVTGLAALTKELAPKIPAADLVQGKGGTSFVKVKFFIKSPKGLFPDEKGNLALHTDSQLRVLHIHGHEVQPAWNNKEAKLPYWFMTGTVETIESHEIGAIFSHWDLAAAKKLWNWEARKASMAKT